MEMIYVITAVHNRYEVTKQFIFNLKNQTIPDYRLLLVDDGSTDGTAEMVRQELENAIILHGNGNLWWGGALHKAYQYLSRNRGDCDYVMYANDDAELPRDFLEKAIQYLNLDGNKLISGCGYDCTTGRLMDAPVQYDFKTGEVTRLAPGEEGNCGTTRALLMTYETYLDIGGFHPVLLPHYASDYEYTIRAVKKGHTIVSFPDLVYRFDAGTTGQNEHLSTTPIKKLFSRRSRFNPIYRLSFLLMVTPPQDIPSNISHGIRRMHKELTK